MVKMNTIAGLVVLCMVSAVAAFFLPNAVGTVLSFVSIGAAAAIGVLAIVALPRPCHATSAPQICRLSWLSCGCSPSAARSDTGPSTCHPTPLFPQVRERASVP